jgi:hypothetical protein
VFEDFGVLHKLATSPPELQKQYEHIDAHTMIMGLYGMLMNQGLRDMISPTPILCKLTEGSLVSHHVIKMLGYIERLDVVGFALLDELAMDMIL